VVVLVSSPIRRVAKDVLADAPEVILVASDVFVVIALPDRCAWGLPYLVGASSGGGLEGAHYCRYRIRHRFAESFRRGTARRAPTIGDDNDSVHMIRHDRERVQFNGLSQLCRPQPFLTDSHAVFIQSNLSISNLAEKAFPFPRAHRDEIRAGLGVVVPFEAYRSPMMPI